MRAVRFAVHGRAIEFLPPSWFEGLRVIVTEQGSLPSGFWIGIGRGLRREHTCAPRDREGLQLAIEEDRGPREPDRILRVASGV